MEVWDKLTILADAAKYDVACTSSGSDRAGAKGSLGSCSAPGICHSFSADGRCVSLLKVLFSNACSYDCKYCQSRRSNDFVRAAFTPRELAELTIAFYRRNYIEGLFLSSAVCRSPDWTCERMIETLRLLREEYRFRGYIHVKSIPGASGELIERLGLLADRMSVNIELPSEEGLSRLAPDKTREAILRPMALIRIVGATADSDLQILRLTQALYRKYQLKRVFFSAYIPLVSDSLLPALEVKPPLLREHRLYQADWLLRYYGFAAEELLDEQNPSFNPLLDPKCNWALNHLEEFPVEVNTAPLERLLRVPGIGVRSAQRISAARRDRSLDFDGLRRIGVVLKRAQYFITCRGRMREGLRISQDNLLRGLVSERCAADLPGMQPAQLSLFDPPRLTQEDVMKCLTGQM